MNAAEFEAFEGRLGDQPRADLTSGIYTRPELKQTDDFVRSDASSRHGLLPRTRFNYGRSVNQGLDSDVVMAPINWIMRNFTEAELRMQRRDKGRWQPLPDHPLVELVDNPNPFYSGDLLWKATALSWFLDGNAYWLKVRNAFGMVVQLWYLPHFLVEPITPRDGAAFISHYQVTPRHGGQKQQVAVRDMVHFRFGLDPRDPRRGLSTLKTLLREVFSDDEAANFSASILRNMGVPGGVIAPKDRENLPSTDDQEEMKRYMRDGFTGDRRGGWLVLGVPTEVQQFGFDPQQLMVGSVRDVAEERVCASLGIPAAVVGFGAGLQSTKVGATMKELRRLAWTSCLQPVQKSLARELTFSLAPDMISQTRRFRFFFDVSQVPAFAEEDKAMTDKIIAQVSGSLLRVDQGQEALGLEVDPTQELYLRPTSVVAVKPGEEPASPSADGGAPPSSNGTGGSEEDLQTRAAALLRANGG